MYIIGALLGFSLLIIIHELGHFTLAKLNGVKVEEFSLGMGPKLFGIKGKETDYIIKAFPIGGYVKMLGEEEKSTDSRAFSSKKPIQKLSIIAAGPIMNFVLAIILFGFIASIKGFVIPTISKLEVNKPAIQAGLKVGDKITAVNGKKITTWDDLVNEVYTSNGSELNVTFLRNGETKSLNITPIKDQKENRFILGISPTELKNPSIAQSVNYGLTETGSLVKQTLGFFKTIFKGKATANDFGGPITIIKVSAQAAKLGILSLMTFLAFLSVQLGIFNIIPFPALDGGWIFMLLIELITGKKLDDNKVGVINYIGFAILMTLMVLVVIKDIIHPVQF